MTLRVQFPRGVRRAQSPKCDAAFGPTSPVDTVIVSTTKPDKYDRYLADVFVAAKLRAESPELRAQSGSQHAGLSLSNGSTLNSQPGANGTVAFLNNALLESGHATRYDGGAKEE